MKFIGGINKVVINGWFEINQEIHAPISVRLFPFLSLSYDATLMIQRMWDEI
jgi:hypothetical protein